MAGNRYILDGHTAKPEPDLLAWAQWFETADRHVAQDQIGEFTVSTVFLGLDHSFGDGPPVLFETMIFGPEGHTLDQECRRYTDWASAEAGHAELVAMVRAATPPDAGPSGGEHGS